MKKSEKINQFAFCLERNWKIAVGEFIFYYVVNPRVNLKKRLPKCGRTLIQVSFRHCTYINL